MFMRKTLTAAIIAASTLISTPVFAQEASPVYLIATITVNDFDAYMANYGSVAIPAIIAAGGEILVGTPEVSLLEGDYVHNWTVVVRFPSEEAAYNWYDSPEYQAVIPFRLAVTNTETAAMILAPQFQPPE